MALLRSLLLWLPVGAVVGAACDATPSGPEDVPAERNLLCGDGYCDSGERRLTCPTDCFAEGNGGGTSAVEEPSIPHLTSGGAEAGPNGEPIGTAGSRDADFGGYAESGIGAPCTRKSDCDLPLDCVTTSAFLDGVGPAGGLCSLECERDSDCEAALKGSLCQHMSGASYCVEGCSRGASGEPKCHDRDDFACAPLRNEEAPVFACKPVCGHDENCGDDQFCSPRDSYCHPKPAVGQPIGTPCSAEAVDPCSGRCEPLFDAGESRCSADCVLGTTGCGWSGMGPTDVACIIPYGYSREGDTLRSELDLQGHLGVCSRLCDCDADCLAPQDACVFGDELIYGGQFIEERFGHRGYCRPLRTGEDTSIKVSDCETGGAGAPGAFDDAN